MPFVRYTRDRRGYETLYVMHAFDGAEKNPRVRVLYASRTVPHARVGRQSIDEGVQRRIEQAYPSLTFDWPRLLKEAAASAPRPERPDPRANEPRGKQRRERKARPQSRTQPPQVPSGPRVPSVPQVRFQGSQVQETIETPEPLEPITELVEWTPLEPLEPVEPVEPIEPVEPVEPVEEPEVPEVPAIGPLSVDRAWPVVSVIGFDRALILRGRYIELAHRVLSRVSSPAERNRLLREAGRLNPESWKTEEQARAGIAGFDEAYARLAEQLRRQPPV